MKGYLYVSLRAVAVPLVAVTLLLPHLAAQGTQEIEIQVVGPLGYVTDPSSSSYIDVIAPNASHHEMHVGPGLDWMSWDDVHQNYVNLPEGLYAIDLPLAPCSQTAPFNGALYSVPAAGGTVDPTGRLNSPHTRFAVRLPKPCSYQQTVASRMMVGPSPIVSGGAESQFATFMILHYTVVSSFGVTTITGKTDDNPQQPLTWTLPFTSTSSSPLAASIVMGTTMGTPDPDCDSDSAAFFDQARTFWGETATLYRLFPGVDPTTLNQGSYDFTSCSQTVGAASKNQSSSRRASTATVPGQKPRLVQPMTPGRTDCHAPQLNINQTVK